MAILGKWTGGTIPVLPGTSYAAPTTALFPTLSRNDSSAYGWNSSTSTLTLPATGLADGYLLVASAELHDTSNGRCNILSKIAQLTGTGDFMPIGRKSGYCRDNSEDRAYTRCFSFINNPSASATFQFQWRRDADAPTGGTARSEFQVIPLYYTQWGGWSSTSTAAAGGVTPTIIPGFTEVGSSGANISFASNVATIKGFGKRYLALGGWNFLGMGNARTQRWGGFRQDGALDDSSKSLGFSRDNSNDLIGGIVSNIYFRFLTNIDIDLAVYRGDGVASGEGGADVDSNTTSASGVHGFVILELDDGCDVFRTTGSTNENLATTGPVDLAVSKTGDLESFTTPGAFVRASDTGINVERDMDLLFGANIGAASEAIAVTTRWTGFAELTVDGFEQASSVDGGYLRGVSISEDTFGWSANLLGFHGVAADEDIGISATELPGSEGHGGAVHVQPGWLGFWGLDLDTMAPSFTGSGSGNLPTMNGSGLGTQTFEGSGSGDLPALDGGGAGTQTFVGGGVGLTPALDGSGVGTQEFLGSGSGELPAMSGSGVGSLEFLGSGSGDLPAMSGSGSGRQFIEGSGSGALPVLDGGGIGTQSFIGAGSGDLPALDGSGAGTQEFLGSGSGDLAALTGDGAGKQFFTGSGSGLFPVLDGSGAGTQSFLGSGSGDLQALTGSGVGTQSVLGSGSGDLPSLGGDGAGTQTLVGSGSGMLPLIDGGGLGTQRFTGLGSGDLAALTGSGAGSQSFLGSGSGELPVLNGDGTGTQTLVGIGLGDLPAMGGTGDGTQTLVGSGSGTLPALEGSGVGGQFFTGSGSGDLAVLSGEGIGFSGLRGSGSGDLPLLTGTGSDAVGFTGSGSGDLPTLGGSGVGVLTLVGSGSGTLAALTGSGVGRLEFLGSGSGDLPAMSGSGVGSPGLSGSGIGMLSALTGDGAGKQFFTGSGSGELPGLDGANMQPPSNLAYPNPGPFALADGGSLVPGIPTFDNGSGGERFKVSPMLPIGVHLSTTTGEITGYPLTAFAATQYTVSLTDAVGRAIGAPPATTILELSSTVTPAGGGHLWRRVRRIPNRKGYFRPLGILVDSGFFDRSLEEDGEDDQDT